MKMNVYGSTALFFQAEDGMRDLTVTGVQTCALPILSVGALADRRLHRLEAERRRDRAAKNALPGEAHALFAAPADPRDRRGGSAEAARLEIGRASVGKEGRSRWSAYH